MLGSDIKEQLNELAAHLEEHLSDSLIAIEWERDELVLRAQRQTLITVMTFLKDDRRLLCPTVVQYTARTKPMIGRTFYGHAQFMYKYKN